MPCRVYRAFLPDRTSPLLLNQQTLVSMFGMPHLCQNLTHAVQQKSITR